MSKEYAEALIREIQTHGVTEWELDKHHNHPRLKFKWQGGLITHYMPGTPSDRRGVLVALRDLRHEMGVSRVIHKSETPKKRRHKKTTVFVPPLPETFVVGADPFLALVSMKDVVNNAIAAARWKGRLFYMAGLSGVAPSRYAPHLAEAFCFGWWDGVQGLECCLA